MTVEPLFEELREALRREQPVVLVTVIKGAGTGSKLLVRPGEPTLGDLGDRDLTRAVERDALGALEAGRSETRRYGTHGEALRDEVAVFVESHAPPPRMVIFGAVDFTAALAGIAKLLGYRVTVCDARQVFATERRFPMADEVVADWPHRYLEEVGTRLGSRDAVCVLTHDPKFDVPAIAEALRTDVGYIGAMGSRRTTEERAKRLLEAGVEEGDLDRVMAPIGLDLGARTPEETAVSICAEIVSRQTGKLGPAPLRDTEGPIHA